MTAPATTARKQFSGAVELKGTSGEIEAVFATMNVIDHDGDVTLPGAFEDGADVVIGSWGHRSEEPPIGKGRIAVQGNEARVRGRLFVETSHGRDAYETLKGLGGLAEWSYLFVVRDHDYGTFQGRTVRFLKAIEVFSVDPVLVGAGIGTRTVALKRDTRAELAGLKAESLRILAGERGDAGEAAVRKVLMAEKALFEELVDPYPEVDESLIPPLVRAAATNGIAAAVRQLGMPEPPSLKWFRKGITGSPTRLGFTHPLGHEHVAYLREDLTPEQAYEVAAHETAHLAGADEDQALRFGEWMLAEALASWRGIY